MLLKVAVIKGDGVGPEMMEPALDVLRAIGRKYGHSLELYPVMASGEAIEACYNPMPEDSLQTCLNASAVLFGNTGLKKYKNLPLDKRPEYALMKLRKEIGVTTNIRPVHLYPSLAECSPLKREMTDQGFDVVFVRDIVGGVLCSEKVRTHGVYGREAYEYEYYNEKIVMDTARIAFELASERGHKITNLDKSNVLESSRLWRQTVAATGSNYPEVELNHCYIDTAAMKLLECPWTFDVIVTSNLFGDIISDEGTQMTGAPCLYASAEIAKDKRGIYTPNQLHFPDESVIGKQIVNPIGMIAAVALMLRFSFQLEAEACDIERAVKTVLDQGFSTKDIWNCNRHLLTTKQMGDKIVNIIVGG